MSKENLMIVIRYLLKQIEMLLPCLVILIGLLVTITYIKKDKKWLRKLINKMF